MKKSIILLACLFFTVSIGEAGKLTRGQTGGAPGVQEELAQFTAFGEMSVAEITPIVQLQFPYNINEVLVSSRGNQSGTADVNNNMARLQTGAASDSSAEILSKVPVKYHPGQGGIVRFTAVYTEGVANSEQIAGIGDTGDGYFFGFNDDTFSTFIRRSGVAAVRLLWVETKSTTDEDVIVTLNGNSKSDVAVTDATGGDATTTANDIAAADYSDVGRGWDAIAIGSTVAFISWCAGERGGEYSLEGVATASGSFTIELTGVDDVQTITAQTEWNVDPADGTGGLPVMDFTKGNVFQIKYQWLGFGDIEYHIEDPKDGHFHLVHVVKYANANTRPSVDNPTLPLYAGALNKSNTSNLTLLIGSMMGGVEGRVIDSSVRHGVSTSAVVFVKNVETPVLTIRNKEIYQGKQNRVLTKLSFVGASQDSTKPTLVIFTFNAVLTGALFTDVGDNTSVAVDSVATGISGGEIAFAQGIAREDKTVFELGENVVLRPGDTLTISIIPAVANPSVIASFNWVDDF